MAHPNSITLECNVGYNKTEITVEQIEKCFGLPGQRTLHRWVMDTADEAIRTTLICMGWTPPKEPVPEPNLKKGVWYQAACSGLWYENAASAGDVKCVSVDGVYYFRNPKGA